MSARILVAMLSGCGMLCAASHYVRPVNPGAAYPYATWVTAATNIQDAIDAAAATEAVVVTNGVYVLDAPVTVSNEVTVRSVNGAAGTVLDGQGVSRCVNIHHPKGAVQGFTITNGVISGTMGGGVHMTGGTLAQCDVVGCYAADYGGGIYKAGGSVVGCTIRHCTTMQYAGGIFASGGSVIETLIASNSCSISGGGLVALGGCRVVQCTITGNRAQYGAGVECRDAEVEGGQIHDNQTTAGGQGGGVCLSSAGGLIHGCAISGNRADYGGGVMYQSASIVSNCQITGNLAGDLGGGVRIAYGGTLSGCQVSGNMATNNGGGVSADEYALMVNCDIRANAALVYGGGVDIYDVEPSQSCILRNCLVTGNRAQTSADGVFLAEGGRVENCTIVTNVGGHSGIVFAPASVMDNSIVYGNSGINMVSEESAASITYCCTTPTNNIVGGALGCTDRDPQLQYPPWNYRLTTNSPCRNTGANQSWMAGANDLDDKPRILESIVDMGAYEFAPYPIQRVTPTYFDFGEVVLGSYTDLEFTVENAGSSTLVWQVEALTMPPFIQYSITSALPPYRWDWFRFAPDVLGPTSCATRILGNGGTNDIYLTGTGIVPEPLALGCYMLTACGAAWLTLRRRQAP